MKRTVAGVAVLCLVISIGLGYVVGRSAGGDTGDSITSRLNLAAPAIGTGPTGAVDSGTAATPSSIAATPIPATPPPATPIPPFSAPATPEITVSAASTTRVPFTETTAPVIPPEEALAPDGSPSPSPSGSARATPATGTAIINVRPVSGPTSAVPSGPASPSPRPATGGDGIPVVFETTEPEP